MDVKLESRKLLGYRLYAGASAIGGKIGDKGCAALSSEATTKIDGKAGTKDSNLPF